MGTPPDVLDDLNALLSASKESFDACLDSVEYQYNSATASATTRLHHLRFDANGQPKIADLARCLVSHAIDYATAARSRPISPTWQQTMSFTQEVRRTFRAVASQPTSDQGGEAGEILLYFLIEAVLQAPQVVAKLELKTNPSLEVNGSDGIHMRWDPIDQVVDVYFGESKLYASVSGALSAAFNSIESFHAKGMRQHELSMVTKHFKGSSEKLQHAVREVLDSGKPGPDARINHACLIGFDWNAKGINPRGAVSDIMTEYRNQYHAEAPRLHAMLESRFKQCQRLMYRFEIFFLPFVSVSSFRDAFLKELE